MPVFKTGSQYRDRLTSVLRSGDPSRDYPSALGMHAVVEVGFRWRAIKGAAERVRAPLRRTRHVQFEMRRIALGKTRG